MQSFFNNIKNLIDNIIQNLNENNDHELPLTTIKSNKQYNGPITIIEHSIGMVYLSTPTFSAKAPRIIECNIKPFLLSSA